MDNPFHLVQYASVLPFKCVLGQFCLVPYEVSRDCRIYTSIIYCVLQIQLNIVNLVQTIKAIIAKPLPWNWIDDLSYAPKVSKLAPSCPCNHPTPQSSTPPSHHHQGSAFWAKLPPACDGPFVVIELHEKKHVSGQASPQLPGSLPQFQLQLQPPPIAVDLRLRCKADGT